MDRENKPRRRPRGCRGGRGRRRAYKDLADVSLDYAKPTNGSSTISGVSGVSSTSSASSIWDWRVYPPAEEDLFEQRQESGFSDALLPLGLC